MRILIVDDSKIVLKINENLCNEIGFDECEIAPDGKEALDLFKDAKNRGEPFDLILSDINMPVMNGFDLVENIRKIDKRAQIIMCTTEGGRQEVVKAIKLGANNYIVKPIKREVLQQKIKEVNEKLFG